MSKCISSHGEYSGHEPGDPCPWCGEYDTERIIAERDEALARIRAVENVLELHGPAHDEPGQDEADCGPQIIADIRRALGNDHPPHA